jgi:UDP-N-acetyl-D-galactosamine dehydrogenase
VSINGLYRQYIEKEKRIAVIGLGYVGLPIALELARHFRVTGFDISARRIEMMRKGVDPSNELPASVIRRISYSRISRMTWFPAVFT